MTGDVDVLAPMLPALEAGLADQEQRGVERVRVLQNEVWALRHAAKERDALCTLLLEHGKVIEDRLEPMSEYGEGALATLDVLLRQARQRLTALRESTP